MRKYYCPRCSEQMKEEMIDTSDGFSVVVECKCGYKQQLWSACKVTYANGEIDIWEVGAINEAKTSETTYESEKENE